ARHVGADFVKLGATVIDVGINEVDGGIVGDVDYDAVAPIAGAITPVPGGVGPLTNVMLLRNTIAAAREAASPTYYAVHVAIHLGRAHLRHGHRERNAR